MNVLETYRACASHKLAMYSKILQSIIRILVMAAILQTSTISTLYLQRNQEFQHTPCLDFNPPPTNTTTRIHASSGLVFRSGLLLNGRRISSLFLCTDSQGMRRRGRQSTAQTHFEKCGVVKTMLWHTFERADYLVWKQNILYN